MLIRCEFPFQVPTPRAAHRAVTSPAPRDTTVPPTRATQTLQMYLIHPRRPKTRLVTPWLTRPSPRAPVPKLLSVGWGTTTLLWTRSVPCHPTGSKPTRTRASRTLSTTTRVPRTGSTLGCLECRRNDRKSVTATSFLSAGSGSTTRTTAPTTSTTSTGGRSTRTRCWSQRQLTMQMGWEPVQVRKRRRRNQP
jgi:hypothetical protein